MSGVCPGLDCVLHEGKKVDLAAAKVIIAGGRPVCSERGVAVLREFADAVGGQVACTRVVVEEGYFGRNIRSAKPARRSDPKSISLAESPELFSTKPEWMVPLHCRDK